MASIPAVGEVSPPRVASDPRQDPMLGEVLDGRYAITEEVGKGAMATVYKAQLLGRDDIVAVKVLNGGAQEEARVRFQREAELMQSLRSLNTVRVHGFGEISDRPYMVMELLEGDTLEELLERRGRLDAGLTLQLMWQVCHSLEEAHSAGAVHRDIKPANIFVVQERGREVVKVLDFGIAKITRRTGGRRVRAITEVGSVMGTPTYLSPEQAANAPVAPQTDFYSLGAVAFHCLAGRPPFLGPPSEVIHGHESKPPPSFATLPEPVEVPRQVESLVMRLLAKRPERRPANAAALRFQIEEILHELTRPEAEGRRGSSAMLAAVAVAVIVASIAVIVWAVT